MLWSNIKTYIHDCQLISSSFVRFSFLIKEREVPEIHFFEGKRYTELCCMMLCTGFCRAARHKGHVVSSSIIQ